MKRFILFLGVMLVLGLASAPGLTQTPSSPAGRWEGEIDANYVKLIVVVSLSNKENLWTGTISIPGQGLRDSPLGSISVKGADVSFALAAVPGEPVYKAKLSADGLTLTGALDQAGQVTPIAFGRRSALESAARFQATPEKGQPGQGIEGSWQGTIDAGGGLRVVVKIRKADTALTALLDSPDQSLIDMAIDTITLKEKTLRFELTRINATFEGTLSADGSEVTGKWDQGSASFPLSLRRLAKN